MSLSDKIAACPKCRSIAKKIDPENHDDLFQQAWLNIYEHEQRNPGISDRIKSHSAYFYRTVYNLFLADKGIEKKFLPLRHKILDIDESINDTCSPAYLEEWLIRAPDDELHLFHQNLITLVIHCKRVKDAIELCGIPKSKFYHYLNQAKERLKDDYFEDANNNIPIDPVIF